MSKVKVGVIGVGYLGQFHAEKYSALPGVDLVGVVDSNAERANLIAKQVNSRAFQNPDQLLGRVDAVSIVVPTALHHPVALQFLRKGIHVLLEKPITVTLEEADELISAAAEKKVVLQIGHIERFNPAVAPVKASLKSPAYITAERAAPFTVRCTDVNVVLDLMIHDLDIVTDLACSEPKELCAAGASVITKEIDMATARIVFRNGCVADITASRVSDEKKRLLRAFDGENVYLSDYQNQKAAVSRRGGNPTPELVMTEMQTERRDTLNEEIKAFLNSVRTGQQPLVSGREGRNALALARLISDTIARRITGFVPVQ